MCKRDGEKEVSQGGQANTPKALCRVLLAGRNTRHEASNEDNARAGVASPTIQEGRWGGVVIFGYWCLMRRTTG